MTTGQSFAQESLPATAARLELFRNLQLEAELLRVLDAFGAAGIAVIVLKGVPLTRRLHGRLDARHMVDNDVLVRRTDVGIAGRCLSELGYTHEPYHSLEGDLRSNYQSALRRTTPSGSQLWLELHWSAFPPSMFPVSESLQWERTQTFLLKGRTVKVFDPAMTMVHLAAHFAQHRCAQPHILRDVAAAWNEWHDQIDLDDLSTLARRTGVTATFAYVFRAISELGWVKAPPPEFHSRKAALLRRLLPSRRLLESEVSRYERSLLTALLLSARRAPGWLLRQAAPPLDRMAVIYEQPVSDWLYLRYPTRPLRALRRLLEGEDRHRTR